MIANVLNMSFYLQLKYKRPIKFYKLDKLGPIPITVHILKNAGVSWLAYNLPF